MLEPAGTKIPEGVQDSGTCGTYATGWLNGTHPIEEGERVKAQVCFHSNTYDEDICRYQSSIEIVNCGTYFLYHLPDASHCYLRYCTV